YYIIYIIKFKARGLLEKLNKHSSDYEEEYSSEQEEKISDPGDDDLLKLEVLVNDIKAGVLVKAGKSATKEQLFDAIAQKVANYDGLHQPAYRYALNNFIIQHSKVLCWVDIEEEELESLWKENLY